jgi:rhodanese-related sulfurtransferase
MDVLQEVMGEELVEMQRSGADFYLIDVREAEEYAEGHIPGAVVFPLAILEEKMKGMRLDRSLVLYCRSGVRSKEGCIRLARAGFTNVRTLRGGYVAWKEMKGEKEL